MLSVESKADMQTIVVRHTSSNVCDRDVRYDRILDGPRTIPAPHKIRCIYPKKSSIATKLESRDHYIMENKQRGPVLSFNLAKLCSNHLSSLLHSTPLAAMGATILIVAN